MAKLIIYVLVLISFSLTNSLPIESNDEVKEDVKEINEEEPKPVEITETFIPVSTNGSKDVYVIKTIVYEVGILTEADNSTLNDTEVHEEVNLTFFDPKHNLSSIDLSNIPVPIQTNISGVEITGIAPVNFGTIHLSENGKPASLTPNFQIPVPLLPNAVVSVKHNISTSNIDKETELLGNLPNLLGLTSPITGEPIKVESPVQENNGNVEEPEAVKEKREAKEDKNDDKKENKNETKLDNENEDNQKSEDDEKKSKKDKDNKKDDKDSDEDNDSKEDKSDEDVKDKKSKNDGKKDSDEKDNSSSSEESDESKESSDGKKL